MVGTKDLRLIRVVVFAIASICIVTIIIGSLLGVNYVKSALQPVDEKNKTSINITIPIGSTTSKIGKILEDKGIVKSGKIFKYYVKFKNHTDFQAGNYKLTKAMSMEQVVEALKKGRLAEEIKLKITVPEGKSLEQIANVLAQKTNRTEKEVFGKMNDRTYIKTLMEKYPEILTNDILAKKIRYPLEGYLFPATYSFKEEVPSIEAMIETMLDKTEAVVTKYQADIEKSKMSIHELLTMSSLVEEEATATIDRKKITSVFNNRIKKKMPLQTDPTVLYALGAHKDRVLYKDLKVDSPYNTYKYTGIPPGPIAGSGEASIEAVLHPDKTDYLYFLAAQDGKVYFAKTLKEHNRLKAKYITNAN